MTNIEILKKVFDCNTEKQLKATIASNPDLRKILIAMDDARASAKKGAIFNSTKPLK